MYHQAHGVSPIDSRTAAIEMDRNRADISAVKSYNQSQLAATAISTSSEQAPIKMRRGSKLTHYHGLSVENGRMLSPDE